MSRPEGWLEIKAKWENFWIGHIERRRSVSDAFEDGADAVIEVLKKNGEYGLHHSETFGGLGWVVFIPDDTQEYKKEPA